MGGFYQAMPMSGPMFQPLLFDRQLRESWFLRGCLRVHAEGRLAKERGVGQSRFSSPRPNKD